MKRQRGEERRGDGKDKGGKKGGGKRRGGGEGRVSENAFGLTNLMVWETDTREMRARRL